MSILRPVIRACAVAALRDHTWAEARVYDSDMTPLADAIQGEAAAPYVVVYTDSDDRVVKDMNLYDGDGRSLSIALEMGIASAVKDTEGNTVLQFAATDQGMELAVDVLETQCISALVGDPHSQWGDLFKTMVYQIQRVPSRRGGQAARGIRFAARRTVIQCTTIYDIAPGVAISDSHPVYSFIRMATDPANDALGLGQMGTIIATLLDENPVNPSWRQAQALLGLSTAAARALVPDGTPLPWAELPETPPMDTGDETVPGLTDVKLVAEAG